MKVKKYIKLICCFVVFALMLNIKVFAADSYNIPKSITINTSKNNIAQVRYNNFTISSKRIRINNRNEVVYCLEIDRGYPSGEVFNLKGDPENAVERIIASGYPSKSYGELNLKSDDEAYFATQIAIWSAIEGYDVNKITGDNSDIVTAIRKIYNDGKNVQNMKMRVSKEYECSNKSIQEVVVVFDNIKYPRQEG